MAIEKSKAPDEFLAFERTGWAAHIAGYNDAFGPVTRQTVQTILDAANVRSGMAIADICCGPGMLAEAAVKRGAKATGIDFPGVVDLARTLVPDADFQIGDALALPFADNSLDAIVCGYGIMHVPDPEKAMKEMLRVLRPGGRAAMSVWDNETALTGLGLIYRAVHDFANLNLPLPHGPNIFQFSTLAKMRDALKDVGFEKVDAVLFQQPWHVKSGKHMLDAVYEGTVRTRALLATQTPEVIDKIVAFLEQSLSSTRTADGFTVPMPAIVGSGAKP